MEIVVALSLIVRLALGFLDHSFVAVERGLEITDLLVCHALCGLPCRQPFHDFPDLVKLKQHLGTHRDHLDPRMRPAHEQAPGFQAAKRFTQRPTSQIKAGTEFDLTDPFARCEVTLYDSGLQTIKCFVCPGLGMSLNLSHVLLTIHALLRAKLRSTTRIVNNAQGFCGWIVCRPAQATFYEGINPNAPERRRGSAPGPPVQGSQRVGVFQHEGQRIRVYPLVALFNALVDRSSNQGLSVPSGWRPCQPLMQAVVAGQ